MPYESLSSLNCKSRNALSLFFKGTYKSVHIIWHFWQKTKPCFYLLLASICVPFRYKSQEYFDETKDLFIFRRKQNRCWSVVIQVRTSHWMCFVLWPISLLLTKFFLSLKDMKCAIKCSGSEANRFCRGCYYSPADNCNCPHFDFSQSNILFVFFQKKSIFAWGEEM